MRKPSSAPRGVQVAVPELPLAHSDPHRDQGRSRSQSPQHNRGTVQWSFIWAPTREPPSKPETQELIDNVSLHAVIVILSGPELLEKHRVLRGSPVPSPEKYIECGNGHVLLVGRADSIDSMQVLEQCDHGLIAKVHFKQAMLIEDGTELWSMTILGGFVSAGLQDNEALTLLERELVGSIRQQPYALHKTSVPFVAMLAAKRQVH